MTSKVEERLRFAGLADKLMSAEAAAALINNGDTLGLSGFTRAGDAKFVPHALVERAKGLKDFKVSKLAQAIWLATGQV